MLNKFYLNNTKIVLSKESFDILKDYIFSQSWTRIFIIIDVNTRRDCLPVLFKKIPALRKSVLIDLPEGEHVKSLEYVQFISAKLLRQNIDKESLLINLGGGVISDLGGFVASVIKRGVSFINIPTTLMAQVDASIGGKVAVNFLNYKNQIGVFNDPIMVFIYPGFLQSLSTNHFQHALSEIFKYGLVFDNFFWNQLTSMQLNKKSDLYYLVLKSIVIKINVVKLDYFDLNERRKLNYGHTISHAIESCFLKHKKPISHGLALSVGLICETYISYKRFRFKKEIFDSIINRIVEVFSTIEIGNLGNNQILNYIKSDKKNSNGNYNFTLIKNIGESVVNCSVSDKKIVNSLDYYRKICQT